MNGRHSHPRITFFIQAPAAASAPASEPLPPPVPGQMTEGDPAMMGDYMSACKKFAEDPSASPLEKAFSAFAMDCTKRMGAMEAAKTDPVIGAAIRRQQGAPVLTPMGGFRPQ